MLFVWLIHNLRNVGNVARCVCHGVYSNCMWLVCFIHNIRNVEGAFFLLADDSVDADDNYLLHPSRCFLTSLPPSASVMCSVYAVVSARVACRLCG